ncbi:hypothetical protein TSTA_059860 [Talaromyces stipitatus ATCC 10500]|uniref:Uncharacterized protein n=1 Tax=Talaromyces stipitatus (strain ATCC 10500 / CBS 375.48 / QM 6759 / NRRL 1006) TaxID=441959 RepID=B8LTB4_TALSN|nr:uncharacterized protein TSTA_059860 [Talaromyces stipitatus ATCC 10500]EED22488.1 hypothetical protein TSTA_059860 [Talaromyces stipitatus ATCC 10500]
MGPKRGKKGTPWPEPWFADDPDIRAYVAAAIKDLEALKKHQEALKIGMPQNAPVFAQLPASMNVTHTGWLLSEYKIKE